MKDTDNLENWLSQNIGGAAGEQIAFSVAAEKAQSGSSAPHPARPAPTHRQAGSQPSANPGGGSQRGGRPRRRSRGGSRGGARAGSEGNPQAPHTQQRAPTTHHEPTQPAPHGSGKPLRCIPLGGLDEVGKNMMVFEYENDIVIVDVGFQFPEEDMLGVDYVIPDISYLEGKEHKIRAILITHGHLDHIGAIPYLLPKLKFPPIYGSKLSMGLVKKRLDEFNLTKQAQMHVVDPDKTLRFGSFSVDWFRVNHSIPDSLGILLKSPAGNIVHTGDFKFDLTPVYQEPTDFAKIGSFANQNISALFSDSTNALKAGHTLSEKQVGENLEKVIAEAPGRIIIAAFSSLIGRLQFLINAASRHGRKVYVSGRSMSDNISIAQELSFIKTPPGIVNSIKQMPNRIKDADTLILTTGAQGEAVSALARMGLGDHPQIRIKPGDTIILSSSPIPGNEKAVFSVINNLVRLGARVIFNQVMDVHTSGHAQREDLKLMINLVKPRSLVPVHGEIYMRHAHAEIGRAMGLSQENAIVIENGDVLEIHNGQARATKEKVSANYIMIDGKGIGDVGAQIIMDRQIMSQNGVLTILLTVDGKTKKLVKDPEIITRGFIYMDESQELVKETISRARKGYEAALERFKGWKRGDVKAYVRTALDRFTHRKIGRNPLILPVIIEV